MAHLPPLYHLRPAWLRQAFFLIALTCAVCAGQASACVGSADPVITRLEIEVGRNPLAALDSIAQEIADTDPLDKRRLAELYIVQAKALMMGGADSAPALKKARSAASELSERAPANILLQMNAYYDLPDEAAKRRAMPSLLRGYRSLPDGSSAKTCRAVDLAFNYSFQEKPREAFTFASQAYLNSADDKSSPARAEAESSSPVDPTQPCSVAHRTERGSSSIMLSVMAAPSCRPSSGMSSFVTPRSRSTFGVPGGGR